MIVTSRYQILTNEELIAMLSDTSIEMHPAARDELAKRIEWLLADKREMSEMLTAE